MKKWILTLVVVLSISALAACNKSDSSAVAKSDAGSVTKEELYDALKDKYGQAMLQQLMIEKVLEDKYPVSDKTVNAQVKKSKDQLGDNFTSALTQAGYASEKDYKESVKIGLMEQKAAKKALTVKDADVKKYYNDEVKADIRASHILVADEKTAKSIEKKIKDGQDFATLAKKYSTDTASAKKGGDLGWFNTGEMDTTFETAAYKLKKGEVSDPVQTSYGYHIIKLTDTKTKKAYDKLSTKEKADVKEKYINSKVDNAAVQKALQKLLKDNNVKVKDSDLKDTFTSLLNGSTSNS